MNPGANCSALLAAAAILPAGSALAAEDANNIASSRMSYSRFLEYLDMGRVKKVRRRPIIRHMNYTLINSVTFE